MGLTLTGILFILWACNLLGVAKIPDVVLGVVALIAGILLLVGR